MKTLYKLFVLITAASGVFLTACKKSFLDRPPLNLVTTATAYGSLQGVQALAANLYENIQFEDLNYGELGPYGQGFYLSMYADEATPSYTWQPWGPSEPLSALSYWDYSNMYNLNSFIQQIPGATALTQAERDGYEAEIRFLRAFDYFQMVKRYGGVPIITQPQVFTGDNLAELRVPRNTEQQVYDFIAAECDTIANILPVSYSGGGAGTNNRPTKWAALALKCRAMLYAGSIAEYGSLQLNGIVGVPASLAGAYWQKAYDAANIVMTQGGFSLYNQAADPAANFQQLFLNGDASTNTEAIFCKSYLNPNQGNFYDFYNQPNPFWLNYSSSTNPSVNMVEQFEYIDGSPGKLKINDASGNPILYNNTSDLFANKDPRLFGSIMTPNSIWAYNGLTQPVEIRRGIIDGANTITESNYDASQVYGVAPNQITIAGSSGPFSTSSDATKSGFYVKKYLTMDVAANANGTSTEPLPGYMVFRYGEVLLNFAEAAVELGKNADALGAVNQIRQRAGIATLVSVARDDVRHERQVELAFENQRYWDLVRWRIATTVINNFQPNSLEPYLVWQANTPIAQMKYLFQVIPNPKPNLIPLTFTNINYYLPIASGDISSNPSLVQNPGY